ncbi:MAG TPA: hypothetical protein VHQ86_01465 [Candidatus Saccharimonadia bacterium]|jgi:hypothetical protein|nr:hypothetical protein [Candidatus Saccharimonadia bacterium]
MPRRKPQKQQPGGRRRGKGTQPQGMDIVSLPGDAPPPATPPPAKKAGRKASKAAGSSGSGVGAGPNESPMRPLSGPLL